MNLRTSNGKIPIDIGHGNFPIMLVDAPDRELFDSLFHKSVPQHRKDVYWQVLQMRLAGQTLHEVAVTLEITRERVRQMEAKMIRQIANHWIPKLASELAIRETIRPLHGSR